MSPRGKTFTIITPSYNSAAKLRATIESVLAQDPDLYEYLIIDGGSRDETLEVLAGYDGRLRWVSEPDRGIYDAMNKGIALASGRYLYFLGAGDLLQPFVLEAVAARLPEDDFGFVYGSVRVPGDETPYYGEVSLNWLCFGYNLCHQAIFYGRGVVDALGGFDLRYPLRADYAYNLLCFSDPRVRVQYLDLVIAEYEASGVSHFNEDAQFVRDFPQMVGASLGLSRRMSAGPVFGFLCRLKFSRAFRACGRAAFRLAAAAKPPSGARGK
jgi:glycosyltransferase involved in cell wall biosynthesis